jgi:serine protease Do
MALAFLENQITDAVEKLSASVVTIDSTRFERSYRYGVVPLEGSGSGLILNSRGHIITNNHVIDGADTVRVTLRDGRSFVGDVVGGDSATDVAVVRVDANDLPAASLGDSEKLKVGQLALAIGNTFGLPGGPTVSTGVVSALGRALPGADFIFEGFIQTDAAINPGNSGGPLADLNGNVIGINTAIIPFAHGVGFAIPINSVRHVADQILEKGRVVRPWLGISGATVNPMVSRRFNLQAESGVLILEVSRPSPAYEAGLRVGDVIVEIGPYAIKEMKDVLSALSKLSIGQGITVSIVRRGFRQSASLRLVEAPAELMERRAKRR